MPMMAVHVRCAGGEVLQKRLDCRGHLIVEDGSGGAVVGEAETDNPYHMVVVVAWLLVKEASRLLSYLVVHCPIPVSSERT
jgi:hypothetical protein